MELRKIRKGILFVVAGAALGLGCELVVDFDRTLIPVEGTDAATLDGSVDATIDASKSETSVADAADAADAADTSLGVDAADAADANDGS